MPERTIILGTGLKPGVRGPIPWNLTLEELFHGLMEGRGFQMMCTATPVQMVYSIIVYRRCHF